MGAQLMQSIQQTLDLYRTGLVVTGVAVQGIDPPQQVQAAFDDAAQAHQDRERAKRDAQVYASTLVPRAQADAARTVDEAKAYAARVVSQAQGDADRFKQVYAQYEKSPAVVRERMYLETMQDIYSNTTKVFVGKAGTSVVNLPLDKLLEAAHQAAPAAPASAPAAAASAPAASGASAVAPNAASQPAGASDALRSRDAFRSRTREEDE
jgi:membrane protease subunit HflK